LTSDNADGLGGASSFGLVKVSAASLHQAFMENEVAADDRYAKARVLVGGVVGRVTKGPLGGPYLEFNGAGFLNAIHGKFRAEDLRSLARLKSGQKINILCSGAQRILSVVSLNDCKVFTSLEEQAIVAEFVGTLESKLQSASVQLNPLEATFVLISLVTAPRLPKNSKCVLGSPDIDFSEDVAALTP